MFLLVRSDRFQGSLVHSLGTNVEPVLVELLISHICRYRSLLTLQPLFGHWRRSGSRLSAMRAACMLRGVLIVLSDFQNSVLARLTDPEMKATSPAALRGWKNRPFLNG